MKSERRRRFPAWLFWHLDADDTALVESIARTGRTVNADAVNYYNGRLSHETSVRKPTSMQLAERLSRNADRSRSTWFNDDMLSWWRDKWQTAARLRGHRNDWQLIAELEREKLEAREADPEERAVLRQEWSGWEREQAWRDAERKRRNARWLEEEREWYAAEAAAKAARLKAASREREAKAAAARALEAAIAATQRTITKVEKHVSRQYQGYSRHPRKNAGDLETA